ncbi:hypothetical protein EMIT019CA3_10180 [Bacillus pseudomycoides]
MSKEILLKYSENCYNISELPHYDMLYMRSFLFERGKYIAYNDWKFT